ncbi:hypothetical protein KKI17_00675 [Patescibacteria group bacterium]|nr:hypothetical protein [Patescibacteria group bacterium]
MNELSLSIIKVAVTGTSSFLLAFLLTPALLRFLYAKRLWRKKVREQALGGGTLPTFQKFHAVGETNIPRFGGMLVWFVPPAMALLLFLFSQTGWVLEKLNFLSRGQTWLPLATLLAASAVGFADDLLQVTGPPTRTFLRKIWEAGGKHIAGGLSLRYRFLLVAIIGLSGGWWFYGKLGLDSLHIPGNGDLFIGIWMIPFFLLIMLATYSGGVIDGLDGLAGGTFASIFTAFGVIAFARGQIDLAAFCIAIVGALLAFLWYNIPPARFYMGETGMMGLTAALTVVAFLTDSVLVLPIIGFLLVLESGSVITQLLSKKFLKKKLLIAAPIHHHLEALGWPQEQITMRFWLIGIVMAIVGVGIRLLG